jgi:ABC-2 type transport system ATP-binding protein
LSTLLNPDGGKASVGGHDVSKDASGVRQNIGLTGQYAAVDEYLTGRENLYMIGRLYRMSKSDAASRSDELLEKFDLVEAGSRAVKTYSGGMRRRLDLAMSLIANPPVIFLDEPTTGLDPRSRLTLWGIIKDLAKAGTTILLTTQYMEEADVLADNIVVIDHGKVIAEGTAKQLKSKIGSERIELTISKKSNFADAAAAVKAKNIQSDAETRTLSITAKDGVNELRSVLQQLDSKGITVTNLSLHQPTLDDVFLTLTGKGTDTRKEAS